MNANKSTAGTLPRAFFSQRSLSCLRFVFVCWRWKRGNSLGVSSCATGFPSSDSIFVSREKHRLINWERERDLSFSRENGGFFLRRGWVSEETLVNGDIRRHFAMRGSDLAGRDDRPGDRLVVAAALDGARLPRPPQQVQIPLDGAAGLRRPPPLARLHRPLRLHLLVQFQRQDQGQNSRSLAFAIRYCRLQRHLTHCSVTPQFSTSFNFYNGDLFERFVATSWSLITSIQYASFIV